MAVFDDHERHRSKGSNLQDSGFRRVTAEGSRSLSESPLHARWGQSTLGTAPGIDASANDVLHLLRTSIRAKGSRNLARTSGNVEIESGTKVCQKFRHGGT
jgi:hypothetical protein